MKKIEEYTADELSAKINAIKAEREKTANALKRYEEELERRKQEVPLGVPCDTCNQGYYFVDGVGDVCNYPYLSENLRKNLNFFPSYKSAKKHSEMLLDWRKALVANAKGEPIDIRFLVPLLKKGWVWMQDDRRWYWSKEKPEIFSNAWRIWNDGYYTSIFAFNLKPADDWKTSLMECGL